MSINVSEVIWTVICFFVLLFVLKKFLFDPLITFMDDRKARVDSGMAEKREAEQLQKENEDALRESWKERNDEAKHLVTEGKIADEKEQAEALHTAQAQAEQVENAARDRVAQESAEVQSEVNAQMDELVTILTKQLLPDESK